MDGTSVSRPSLVSSRFFLTTHIPTPKLHDFLLLTLSLYNNDRLDEWVEKARELINGPGTTRYHRMKMLILLSSTLGEWEEAEECRYAAETLWRVHRSWHPEGKNEELDIYMVEIRASLDKVVAVSNQEDSELDDEVLDDYGRPVTQPR
jgi:hypothetical protein